MLRSTIAALAIAGTALMAPAIAGVASAAPASADVGTARHNVCTTAKCELHRTESRLHIPHRIHNGIRW